MDKNQTLPATEFSEKAFDANPEKVARLLEQARRQKAEAERMIGLCEASQYRTGQSYIGSEPTEDLSKETRLLHLFEMCEAAVGNMKGLMEHLANAGRPGLAEHYRSYADSIQKKLDAEEVELLKGPHGKFLRESRGVFLQEPDSSDTGTPRIE